MASSVRVVVRVRPQMENELLSGGSNIAHFDNTGKTLTIDGQRKATFTFDRAFGADCTQEEVYTYAAKPIVEDVLKGYNGTIFAYGQTSSGKTHTMEGPDIDGPERGIIPRIVQNIFQYIELAPETLEFTVRVSYFEIYMERIRDLLCDGNDNLQIHENRERGVYVRHATELFMQDPEEVMEVMRSGAERRSVASTQMNDISSRSHSVFLMEITQKDSIKGGVKTGKLYLVDLAGSEKVSKTGADGEVLEEAKNINKSLSALGLVIMSLTENQARQHVPYRDSKLTRILQESLGGNARTTIIICCSPSSYNEAETFSSLRFGQRAKKIKNNAVVNQQYSAEELTKQLDAAKKEIKKLVKRLQAAEKELEIWRQGGSVSEAERVALGASAGDEEGVAAPAAAVEDGGDAGGGGAGMTDEERDELLRSQNELLELIDEKDETIRQLEREVDVLGQDKITITKLASENAAKSLKISELEEKFDEAVAENTEYEVIIEDMARANNRLDEEHNRTKQELDRLIEQSKGQEAQYQAVIQSIADMVGALAVGKITGSTRQLPVPLMETGTVVDAQLSKARSYISQLQAELSQTKKNKDEVNDDATKSKARLDTVESSLSAAKLTIAQLEQNMADLTQKNRSLDAEKRELHLKNEALSSELTDYMDKLILAEEACEKSKQEAGNSAKSDAEVHELKAALERQRELQREQHQQQLKDLHAQVDNISKERQELAYERDKLQLEINQLRSDVEKKTAAVQQQLEKIENLSQRVEQTERAEKEAQGISEATKSQLEAYSVLKTKMMENLTTRMRVTIGERKQAAVVANDKDSKHVEFLQKTIDQLNLTHTEAVKEKTTLQRENAQLQKQLESARENLANLRTLMTETENRLMNAHQRHKQDVSAERTKPRMVRRKSQNAAQAAPVVRGGAAKGTSDATKAKFWEDQSKQQQSSTPASRNSGITGQGQPLVGQHAARTPSSPAVEKALEVEYV